MPAIDISVIIPCLNEENTIVRCVESARSGIRESGMTGEVIVVDNGSTDSSAKNARNAGASVVTEMRRGYGSAYLKGISECKGRYLVLGDGDCTYDFCVIPELVKPLLQGTELVLGSRFKGTIEKGAMPFTHRRIGNPVLTGILNLFFKSHISDAHTGLRAITLDAVKKLSLKTTGMEFASEMIISALRTSLKIQEIPITYRAREGISKLHPLSDAWRHLRFMLLFSPTWLFFVPGALLFFGGAVALVLSGSGRLVFMHHKFDIHAMVFFALFCLLGFQIIMLGLFARAFSLREGFEQHDHIIETAGRFVNLELGIVSGITLFLTGFGGSLYIVVRWIKVNFTGPFDEIKLCLFCLMFMMIGIQVVFSSFFLSLLKMPRNRCS